MPVALALGTFLSTIAGGAFALRHKDRLHVVLGFSAGVILAVVAFDLLPEIDRLARETHTGFQKPMIALVVGFLAFHVIEKALLIHNAHEDEYGSHSHPSVGVASALALTGHSLADGMAIGLGFQVGSAAGFAVALAVIGHDFADGRQPGIHLPCAGLAPDHVDDHRIPSHNGTEIQTLHRQGEVLHHPQAVPPRGQHGAPQRLLAQSFHGTQHVVSLLPETPHQCGDLGVARHCHL